MRQFLTVTVAQLAEHLVVAQVAVGSSPISHPIFSLRKRPVYKTGLFFFLTYS